jgi:hypothetical protein
MVGRQVLIFKIKAVMEEEHGMKRFSICAI